MQIKTLSLCGRVLMYFLTFGNYQTFSLAIAQTVFTNYTLLKNKEVACCVER